MKNRFQNAITVVAVMVGVLIGGSKLHAFEPTCYDTFELAELKAQNDYMACAQEGYDKNLPDWHPAQQRCVVKFTSDVYEAVGKFGSCMTVGSIIAWFK